MRERSVLLLPAAIAMALACGACGGSNSETPWPVPPDDVDLGPEGEARRDQELSSPSRRGPRPDGSAPPPDGGSPRAPGNEPAAEPPAPPAAPTPPGSPATQF